MLEHDGKVNKEFIPLLFIIATPVIAYMNGFGVRTARFAIDIYYLAPLVFALVMNARHGLKKNFAAALVLLGLNIFISLPVFQGMKTFEGNFACLYIHYGIILAYYTLFAASFLNNDPYFAGYYSTNDNNYKKLYFVAGLFFLGVALFHGVLFIRITAILMVFKG